MPPVVAAIGTALTTVGGLTIGKIAIGKFILQVGSSLLLSAASRALSPNQSSATDLQGRNISVRQPVAPREMVYGTVRKGGIIVYMDQYGPKTEYVHMVIVLAGHSVESIGTIYFDGIPAVSATQTDSEGIYEAGGYVVYGRWVGFVDAVEKAYGMQTTNPFPILAGTGPKWGPNHILQGCAAVAIRLNLDPNAFPNGIPAISFDVQGKNDILDPRTGARGLTNNPALCVADYMAMPENLGGMGAAIGVEGGIDSATLIESANICDETVGDENRYSADGVVTLEGSARRSIIQSLLTSMAGSAVYRGSKWYILAGAYRAPDICIGPDDFDEKSFDLQTRRPMRDNYSCVRGQFISPENDWQPDDFPAYKSAVYIAEDNGIENWLDISLPFTKSAIMAQRLAKIALEKQRRQMSVSFSGKLPLFKATAGDTVAFNFPVFGIENKPFDVESVSLSGDGESGARLELVLRETSPLIYEWGATEEQIYAAAPRTNLPSAFDIDPPFNIQATESLYAASIGQGVRARVTLTWSGSPSINAAEYEAQFKLSGSNTWLPAGVVFETILQINDFKDGVYDFRVRARSRVGVVSDYSTITQVIYGLTAPPLQLQNLSIYSISGIALLQWDQTQDLDVFIGGDILIAHSTSASPTWANASEIRKVSGSENGASVELMQGAYLIRARDSVGNLGPISVVYSSASTALPFSPLGFLQEDNEFSGEKDGTAVYGNAIILDSSLDLWASPDLWAEPDLWVGGEVVSGGIYNFSSVLDLGAVKSVKMRRDVEFDGLRLNFDLWGITNLWAESDLWGSAPDTDVAVDIAITNDDPDLSPVWSDWFRVTVTEVAARGVKARAILTTGSPRTTPIVTRLRIYTEEVTI